MNPPITIAHTLPEDIDTIFVLYDDAIAYQKQVGNNHWLGFERTLVEKEIAEKRHYKVLMGNEIVGTYCITREDKLIWQGDSEPPAIYIHRIATSAKARGQNLVKHILKWAVITANQEKAEFIRIDTGAGNNRLVDYYVSCGFKMIGTTSVKFEPGMPEHYKNGVFALLEMPVQN